jgi:telomere length regulation protein
MALPQLTNELWDLLLSLRTNALRENDVKTLDAILFAFLTLLELNEDKQRLANEHARELVETQEWAKLVLDQYGSESGQEESEGGKVKMLAAAVVLKCHEVVERWQRLMLGDMVDF